MFAGTKIGVAKVVTMVRKNSRVAFWPCLKHFKALVVVFYYTYNAMLDCLCHYACFKYYTVFGLKYIAAQGKCPLGCPTHKNRRFHTCV